MIENLTSEQRELVALQLALENNAMLRVVISNQVKIMQRLGIEDFSLDDEALNHCSFGGDVDKNNKTSLQMKLSEILSSQIEEKAWWWVQLKTSE